MKIVIRAGGVGTRLWPMSRQDNPKQFQTFTNDKSLIRNTVDRVKPLLGRSGDLFISVSQHLIGRLKKEIPELPDENIIVEPVSRNTGPAICLESCVLAQRFGKDITVASLPSDDYISDAKAFCKMLIAAEKFLEKNPEYIITPGVKPIYPDTGYSYMKVGKNLDKKIFEVANWIEKPNLKHCKKLIRSGKYLYHTGMYLWKIGTILDLFSKFQPKMYEICKKIAIGQNKTSYTKLEKITIERAITKKALKIVMIVFNKIGWSDLGKWYIIAEMASLDQDGNALKGNVITFDSKNCLIYGFDDKLIAAVGLDNIVIVQRDDALLVCPKDKSGEVKKIVEELKKRGMKKYL